MKHLPNMLTLGNLICGCIAIAFILSAQNFTTAFNLQQEFEVPAMEQPYWGSIFIFLAALFDMLDGAAARALNVYSPIGKDLDSLADLVSFGVAPSMILFKMLWAANITQPEAMDVNMLAMTPAFLVACFGALRLAKFNITATAQSRFFIGMPIPAVGILIATLPLINWQNPLGIATYFYSTWVLYGIIALVCWLMVSKIRFFKFMPAKWNLANTWPQLIILLASLASFNYLKTAAITLAFALYILLAFIYKPKEL
jgi:CDP-diacylglycerol--serine O-phosphatidyltransferase